MDLARSEEAWAHTAWTCCLHANLNRDRKKQKQPFKPDEFNPLRLYEKQREQEKMTTKEAFELLKAEFFK